MRPILSPLWMVAALACGAPPAGEAPSPATGPAEVHELREALHHALTGPHRDDDAELARFYALRDHRPAFVGPDGPLPTARDVVALLADARSHGLRPEVYEASRLARRVDDAPVDLAARLQL